MELLSESYEMFYRMRKDGRAECVRSGTINVKGVFDAEWVKGYITPPMKDGFMRESPDIDVRVVPMGADQIAVVSYTFVDVESIW